MSWINRFFSKETITDNPPTTFIGFMPSLITAEESFNNLSFTHGDRRIIAQESCPETIIIIAGEFKEKEVKEIKQKICKNSISTEKVTKTLNPILVDLSKRNLCGEYLILVQPENA